MGWASFMTELNRLIAEFVHKQLLAERKAIRDLIFQAGPDFDWNSHFIRVVTNNPNLFRGDREIVTTVTIRPNSDYPIVKDDATTTRVYLVTPEAIEHVFRKADDDAGAEETNPR